MINGQINCLIDQQFFKLDDEDEEELSSQHHKIVPKKTL